MKNFKWLFLPCALLFIVGVFLVRNTHIQARNSNTHAAASATNYQLASVATISSSDVWTVGKTGTTSAFSSLIEHWDGNSWHIVPSPNPQGATDTELTSVSALSSSDVWTVGFALVSGQSKQQSVIEHWDGTSWSPIDSPSQPSQDIKLQGVSALSSSDVWAVGYATNSQQHTLSLIEHWDGSQWHIVTSTNPSLSFNSLTSVKALSSSDVWAVGYALGYAPPGGVAASAHPSGGGGTFSGFHPIAEHWNGSIWSTVSVPDPPENLQQVYQSVIANSSTDIWAVGYSFTTGNNNTFTLVGHWNGSNWQKAQLPTIGINNTLTSITALSPQDIWAVGSYQVDANSPATPLTEHWDGQQWTIVPSPSGNVGYAQANGISAISSQDAWFVGGSALTEHWNGTDWQVVTSPTP